MGSAKRLLITGATGSLGQQIIYELAKRGCFPIAHVREGSPTAYIDSLGLDKRLADLRDDAQVKRLVEGVEGIIHTAAWVDFRQNKFTQFAGINTIAALRVFRAAQEAGVQRFVHVSSVAATAAIPRANAGDDRLGGAALRVNEDTPFNLGGLHIPYIMTKRAAEEELLKAAPQGAAELVIVNPSIIIAPSASGDDRAEALRRLPRFVLPGFSNRINIVDIRDVAPAVIAALEKGRPNQRYILAGDNITAREFVLFVSQALGRVPHVMHIPRPLIEFAAHVAAIWSRLTGRGKISLYPDLVKLLDYDWAYSSMKARTELGYTNRSAWMTLDELLHNRFYGTYLKPGATGKPDPAAKPA